MSRDRLRTEGNQPLRERQLTFRILYQQPTLIGILTENDRRIFNDLLDLLQENEGPSVIKEIQDLKIDNNRGRNIIPQEQEAIRNLSNNKTFIIREADKGGNVVLWYLEEYMKEAKRQLNNRQFYYALPTDPTDTFKRKIDRLISTAVEHGIITKKEAKYLQVDKPVTPTFYLVPKIHKSLESPPVHHHQPRFLCQRLYAPYRAVGTGTEETCMEFISELNDNNLNIKLIPQISENTVEFLDLGLSMDENKIKTSLYRKPTATNSVLHYDSFHPRHLKKAIPYGQFLRLKRNCSDDCDYRTHTADLTARLKA
ncbi:uncharacterized protein [Engystomops pustulosus]|uniref:uncharacterized protein n=1 Tax=Engystomops pustulosus TaxID=76066 RepID=UPI003AFA8E2A